MMVMMYRPIVVATLLVALFHCNVAQQIQMPEAGALHLTDEPDLNSQVLTLQRNISELWTYIYQLRSAVSQHLNHLRQHQVELEDVVHRMSHYHEGQGEGSSAAHTDGYHHSGEQHSHSSEHHSHGDDQHSHSGEHHSHGDDHHSHGDEHHSHSGEHSYGGDDHSHGSHDHYHDSHSHSHSHDGHGSHSSHEEGGEGHHHHDHKDSHEKEDELQQSQQGADLQQIPQGAGPVAEPVIVPTVARSHNSHVSSGSSGFRPLPLMNNHHHHHHHTHEPRRNRSRIVVMPKYSEYDLYEFAVCNVQPNRAIPEADQQEITGQVTLWQKKMGGPLNLHVRLTGFDMGDHHAHQQQAVQQEDDNETPAPVGHKHGFHVHASGDLSNGCQSTGGHYNPKNANHGGPTSLVRHVGDLGNIECDDHGVANIVFSDDVASLKGSYSIIGKAIVIHALVDDYGLGGNEESLRTGNAGTRLACCVIEKVDKLPIRSYKAIKTAKQYQNY